MSALLPFFSISHQMTPEEQTEKKEETKIDIVKSN
jgi:hypothetical protein